MSRPPAWRDLPSGDNPVARQGLRMLGRSGRWPALLALLAGAAVVALLMQRYWMELDLYDALRPAAASRWVAVLLLAESLVVLPWAAARGALLWRRLQAEEHLDQYRRSRLSPAAITMGAVSAAARPVLVLALLSLALALPVSRLQAPAPGPLLLAHLLLFVQGAAYAAFGIWLSARIRSAGLASAVATTFLGVTIVAVGLLGPALPHFPDPGALIQAALVPNPITALGAVLDTDVLRFGWVYRYVRATDYFYVYPPAWQTLLCYASAGVAAATLAARRLSRDNE